MKKSFPCLLISVFILSCSKSHQIEKVVEWDSYEDPYLEMSFNYPKNWPLYPETGRISVYSSPEVVNRFYDFSAGGPDGIRLTVSFEKQDTIRTVDQWAEQLTNEILGAGFEISSTKPTTIAGNPGFEIQYAGNIDNKNRMYAVQAVAVRDSMRCHIKYEAFNQMFDAYKSVYDTALASLRLPEPQTVGTESEPPLPSTVFDSFQNQYLSISYPDNFDVHLPKAVEPAVFSMEIKGYRQDCDIHIDVIPAKSLSGEKVVEQNAKYYKEKSKGETTIDGVKTVYLNYSPVKDIESRVYFLVKNDRFFRVIFNYYSPMKENYLAAFEKTVGSLKVK